jgi:hypothetical protein
MASNKINSKPINRRNSVLNAPPREVELRVIFLRIGDIDTLSERFFAEILIESKWQEPKLVNEFQTSNEQQQQQSTQNEEKEILNGSKYWNPQIFVENALNDPQQTIYYKIKKEVQILTIPPAANGTAVSTQSGSISSLQPIQETKEISSNDLNNNNNTHKNNSTKTTTFWMYEYRKMKGYFFEKLELNFFPFDIQDLSIIITTFKQNRELRLVQNRDKHSLVNSKITVDRHIWHIYHHVDVKLEYENNSDDDENDDEDDDDDDDDDDHEDDYGEAGKAEVRPAIVSKSHRVELRMANKIKKMKKSVEGQQTSLEKENYRFSPIIIFQCKAGKITLFERNFFFITDKLQKVPEPMVETSGLK